MKNKAMVGLSKLARLGRIERWRMPLRRVLMGELHAARTEAYWLRRLKNSRSLADQIEFGEYIGSRPTARQAFLERLASFPTLSPELKRAQRATLVVHRELSQLEKSTSGRWWFRPAVERRWFDLLLQHQSEGLFIVASAYLCQSPERSARFLSFGRFNGTVSPKMREALSAIEIMYARLRHKPSTSEHARVVRLANPAATLAAGLALVAGAAMLLNHSRLAEWHRYTTEIGELRQISSI